MANLAHACDNEVPGPLDTLPAGKLDECVTLALGGGWLDEQGWLSPVPEAMALYELMTALPAGKARAEIERRVRGRLLEGNAGAFVALATRMALAGDEGLGAEPCRTRLSLCMTLPSSSGVRVDRLALALLSRRELAQRWVEAPSRRTLPERRTAARVLEQGARGIVRQVAQGHGWPLRLLSSDTLAATLPRLLADREPLVWRHAAVARGLLASLHPPHRQAILAGSASSQTATEWRRAAASLTAWAGSDPAEAAAAIRRAEVAGFFKRDAALVRAALAGLAAAAEVEPSTASALLDLLLDADPLNVAEALPELLAQGFSPSPAALARAADALRKALRRPAYPPDDGAEILWAASLDELERRPRGDIAEAILAAQMTFVERGAREAADEARRAVALATERAGELEQIRSGLADGDVSARKKGIDLLRDFNRGLLSDDTLDALLLLADPDAAQPLADLARVRDRVAAWTLSQHPSPPATQAPPHLTAHLLQLRTLLYAADARDASDLPATSARQRRHRIAAAMLQRLRNRPHGALERGTCAALARAFDALIGLRELDPIDIILLVARANLPQEHLQILREASTHPGLEALLDSYTSAFRPGHDAPPSSSALSIPPTRRMPGVSDGPLSAAPLQAFGHVGDRIGALLDFAHHIEADPSTRSDAVRSTLLRLGRSLSAILSVGSMADALQGPNGSEGPLVVFDLAWHGLLQHIASAERRLGLRHEPLSLPSPLAPALAPACARRALDEITTLLSAAQSDLERTLPEVFSGLAAPVIGSLVALPLLSRALPPAALGRETPLPPWVPPSRSLGAFYLLSPIGAGGAGSVFIARRIEDRSDAQAERFALKVPEYDGTAARSLSEAQFLRLFREEASALLALPQHTNLAQFITFDLASRPKPILVMELVEGASFDQLLSSGSLTRSRAAALLDGILAGLEVMHATGVGHLDLKPQNVILRPGGEPVLVDFGLAGRQVRPGCGSLACSAPEVWLSEPGSPPISPLGADVYAVACLAFEALVGQPLFDTSSEVSAITSHISHDGWPPRLAALRDHPTHGPLAALLASALRRSPADRISATVFRQRLGQLAL